MTSTTHPPALSAVPVAPRVSVIVPTFNRAGLLKETVDAILAQTYTDFELIIVDNMSEDGTQAYIASSPDPRIRYFRNPNNGIISVNRNYGVRKAKGEFIAFCDDDDLWFPEKIEQQMSIMGKDKNIGLCYSNAVSFSSEGVIKNWHMKRRFNKEHFKRMLIGNLVPNSSVLIRREVFDRIGFIDESLKLVGSEDYEFWIRISCNYKLHYIHKMLIKYRIHSSNASGTMRKVALRDLFVLKSIYKKLDVSILFFIMPVLFKIMRLAVYSLMEIFRTLRPGH